MKTIRIHPAFHELFGIETTLVELMLIFIPSVLAALALFVCTRAEWSGLAGWKTGLLFLLIFDGMAGFIANLTRATNDYYRERPRLRLVFIAIHIQPLVYALLLSSSAVVCSAVWVYTLLSAFGVNALASRQHPAQKPTAAALVLIGLSGLLLASKGLAVVLIAALAFYQLKMIFSFAVDHSVY